MPTRAINRKMTKLLTILMSFLCFTSALAEPNSAKVSWYSVKCNGTKTASGVRFYDNSNIVAHKSLPFGTIVHFTNPSNGKSVVGVVRDRGPYRGNRLFDLSIGLAKELGFKTKGVTTLHYKVIK